MALYYRILIKTHHMTSRKKILHITKAAKRFSCSVLLKTGGPPGVMIAEGEEPGAGDWLEVVKMLMATGVLKKLRYKDFQLVKKEVVDTPRLDVPRGLVKELTTMKDLGAVLIPDQELYQWWRTNMGYRKDDDDQP